MIFLNRPKNHEVHTILQKKICRNKKRRQTQILNFKIRLQDKKCWVKLQVVTRDQSYLYILNYFYRIKTGFVLAAEPRPDFHGEAPGSRWTKLLGAHLVHRAGRRAREFRRRDLHIEKEFSKYCKIYGQFKTPVKRFKKSVSTKHDE